MGFFSRFARQGLVALTLAGALASVPSVARAEGEEAAADAGPNLGKVSFNLGFDVTTQYFYRGIFQEDGGLIIQPYADATFALYSGDGFIKSVDWYLGIWNSVHSKETGSDEAWYEADIFTGFSIGLPANFSLDVSYILLDTPSRAAGAKEFAEEIDLSIAYDDSCWWEGVNIPGFSGLQPYFLVAFEVAGASDTFNNSSDTYFEFGIAPEFTLIQSERYPVTLAIPLTIGLGDNYYEVDRTGNGISDDDDAFGYVDVGFDFSMPLSFMPAAYGSWTLTTGVHCLFLGDTTEFINDNDDNFEVIGTIGLSMSY